MKSLEIYCHKTHKYYEMTEYLKKMLYIVCVR